MWAQWAVPALPLLPLSLSFYSQSLHLVANLLSSHNWVLIDAVISFSSVSVKKAKIGSVDLHLQM